jgi:hypothetical protein
MTITAAQIRRLLRQKLAVSPAIAAVALGVGQDAVDNAIERGAIPTVDLGPGARKRPIPTSWLRKVLGLEKAA